MLGHRKPSMSFIDAKPSDSKESLLNDIMAAANQSHMPGLPLRPLAALVIKVADETAETVAGLKAHITHLNEQNAKLQWWVVALAVAALVGTFVQTAAAIYALAAPSKAASQTLAQKPGPVQISRESSSGSSASGTSTGVLSSPPTSASAIRGSQPK